MARPGFLHDLAIRAERLLDRLRPRRHPRRPVLDAYRGYATPEGLVLRGRVLANLRRTAPDPTQSRWQNLRQMVSLFLTDEVADVAVEVPGREVGAHSDEEGYVTLIVPGAAEPGWREIDVRIAGDPESEKAFIALVPQPGARLGAISDIDDTMMQTGAYSLARNLWTTFTGSAVTRQIYPDSVALMDHLSNGKLNPVYYVSSSPWNLHAFLDRVFARSGLVAGPMFLRDLGISKTQFISGTHGDHKGSAIDRIVNANPGLPFVLIGDTGQHDAEVYLAACRRHPGRIRAVILREPGPGPDAASRAAIAEIGRLGVTILHGADFATVPEALDRAGVTP